MSGALLLIGAGGFAGRHFDAEAAGAGQEVVRANRRPAAGELACDLLDRGSVERAVRESEPAAIANLAGAASVAESWRDPAAAFRLNTLGALHLLDVVAAHAPAARVLCVSSGDAYGDVARAELPIGERQPLRPRSPYGASKAAMEVVCGQYERAAGLAIVTARAFNHVGPGQSDRFAASSFARQVAEAEAAGASALELRVGNLELERDFTDVRDTVAAYRLLLDRGLSGAWNVCSGRPTRIGALIEMLDAATELELGLVVDESRLRGDEPTVVVGRPDRLIEATGWKPARPLDCAITELLEWWRRRLAGLPD